MKIQCDVCNKTAASVFCVADDAALCSGCDHQVHHANKLAGKHHRFSLLSPKQIPVCDICQEKRAFLFCQQDRAILCRDCDSSIHKANEHKQTHDRFLLTGIKLSVDSAVYSPPESKSETTVSVPNLVAPTDYTIPKTTMTRSPAQGVVNLPSSSSISDYLIETLPGWHVDDFLDFSASPFDDFCKGGGENLMMQIGDESSWATENTGIWVPQAPPPALHPSQYTVIPEQKLGVAMNLSKSMGIRNNTTTKETMNLGKSTAPRKRIEDWSFTVPQISTPSLTSKRFRFSG